VRADQVLAIAQAFEKLIDSDRRDVTEKSDEPLPIRQRR
jgi:hypothetical protein